MAESDNTRQASGLRRLMHGQFFHCPAVSYRLAPVADPAWNERWRQVMDLELYADCSWVAPLRPRARVCFRYRRHGDQQTERTRSTFCGRPKSPSCAASSPLVPHALGWRRQREPDVGG